SFWHRRKPWISLAGNLSYRGNLRRDAEAYARFRRQWGDRREGRGGPEAGRRKKGEGGMLVSAGG
ncbi:MAG: hypothetical protein M1376_00980, partial [Planctomycetes bacterium]|nr:hypothetical protein [Planctomycetota bacterium]